MEIRIEWSDLAERQLRSIYDYFYFKASPSIAEKVTNKIVNKVSILEKNPFVGQKEELLIDYPEDFRCLVESNYKIIYWIEVNKITIASVFDCRQNPVKMKEIE
jgi:toxin ParE1/3/4